jgi:chorismate mutase/prephenate dehydratase
MTSMIGGDQMAKSHLLQRLRNRRRKIDVIDRKLLPLLNQRLRTALECGKIKKEMGKNVYDPKREATVLKRLRMENRGPLKAEDLEKIFRTIIGVCRRSQK